MAIQLSAHGITEGTTGGRVLGRITRAPVEHPENYLRVVPLGTTPVEDLSGYAAVLIEGEPVVAAPCIHGYSSLDFLHNDYVVAVNTDSGLTRVLYRADSPHNILFATERCNSNCIMCSQPPKETDDRGRVEELLRLIELIPNLPEHLGISGGEPTLLQDGLVNILGKLKERFPETRVTMLSNGRSYANESYVAKLVAVAHPGFLTSIPLYANNAVDHDYVVQAKGAFDQTIQGLYNSAKLGLAVELRVVLHKQTIPGLLDLAEYIYRNLPFVQHVVLMGLENMGYVKKNWDQVWIDPADYAGELEAAVRHLYYRKVAVSLYNLPLCVLPRSLWAFARQSISDFKNIYLDECARCSVKSHCSGLFQSSEARHSRAIKAVHLATS